MLKVAFDVVTYLFAIYGFICLSITAVDSMRQRLCSESSRVKMILVIKNQERTIEGIIRNIFTVDILRKVMTSDKLTIVDMGSNDKTVDILKKLKDDYDFFEIVDEKERNKVFSSFDDSKAVNENKNADFPCQ